MFARFSLVITLALLSAVLWGVYAFMPEYRVFGGVSTSLVLIWAAWVSTSAVVVLFIGRLVLGLGFTLLEVDATGIQRGIVYAILTFATVSIALGSLGLNIGAILTTSALVTAIVGLAMQPTLGSLIAGSTLQLDRVLRVGDTIIINGERIRVLSLTWRSIIGRKHASTVVVLPNARVAENTVEILRHGEPVRAEVMVPAPVTVPPHRIVPILGELAYDIPYVDPLRSVRVVPIAYDVEAGRIRYQIRYWVRRSEHLSDARAVLLRRVWYAFQREAIPWPVSIDYAQSISLEQLHREPLEGLHLSELAARLGGVLPTPSLAGAGAGGVIAQSGPPLSYSDGELVLLPYRVATYSHFIIAEGALREEVHEFAVSDGEGNLSSTAERAPRDLHENRRVALAQIVSILAEHIGPYAEHAVRRAAAISPDPAGVIEKVAAEIEDRTERERFLTETRFTDRQVYGPGFVFGAQRNAMQALVSAPALRAVGGALIVPVLLDTPVSHPGARLKSA